MATKKKPISKQTEPIDVEAKGWLHIPVDKYHQLIVSSLELEQFKLGKQVNLPLSLDVETFNIFVKYLKMQREKLMNHSTVPKEIEFLNDL